MSTIKKTKSTEEEIINWTSTMEKYFFQYGKDESLNIIVLGTENSGKSSLVNSIFSTFNDQIENVASVGSYYVKPTEVNPTDDRIIKEFLQKKPHTSKTKVYDLLLNKDSKKSIKPIYFIDTTAREIQLSDNQSDINLEMNIRRDNDQKKDYQDFSKTSMNFKVNGKTLKIHGAILCVSPYNINKKDHEKLLTLALNKLSSCGIPTVCVANKIDLFDIEPKDLLKVQDQMYHLDIKGEKNDSGLYKYYQFIRKLGFPDENIFFNINYASNSKYQDKNFRDNALEKTHFEIIQQTLWNTEILFRNYVISNKGG